ncbi:LysM domain-containing protein [Streptomyces sp. JJ36]|uniref:lytic transglycosylase n=1 Tax=Streptomyces sp. JJ36 TaxID=2736645 RepID=UPI001F2F8496|nr:LysM domain-containing protein [Streptomyces sp. JJ36]MCF6525088.1 LysM peptidoglycan-binding domain-containing protein [Streptomyces sp. JJ36]
MTMHAQNVTYYTVQEGDNLTVIARRYGTTVEQLVKWNNIPDPDLIHPGQRLIVAKAEAPQDTYYTVQEGDNLTVIARRFGTTVEQLVKWNNIANPDLIHPGQRLLVAKSRPIAAA